MLLVLAGLLAGCGGRLEPGTLPPVRWEPHRAWAAAAVDFALEGRVGSPAGSANLRWRVRDGRLELRLWGPLGAGSTVVTGDATTVTLERAGDAPLQGPPGELLATWLGWPVPYVALSYWARGVPAPDLPVRALRLQAGRATAFEQAGFEVAVDRYVAVAGGSLPGRVVVRRADWRLTLLVRRWIEPASDGTAPPGTAAAGFTAGPEGRWGIDGKTHRHTGDHAVAGVPGIVATCGHPRRITGVPACPAERNGASGAPQTGRARAGLRAAHDDGDPAAATTPVCS